MGVQWERPARGNVVKTEGTGLLKSGPWDRTPALLPSSCANLDMLTPRGWLCSQVKMGRVPLGSRGGCEHPRGEPMSPWNHCPRRPEAPGNYGDCGIVRARFKGVIIPGFAMLTVPFQQPAGRRSGSERRQGGTRCRHRLDSQTLPSVADGQRGPESHDKFTAVLGQHLSTHLFHACLLLGVLP